MSDIKTLNECMSELIAFYKDTVAAMPENVRKMKSGEQMHRTYSNNIVILEAISARIATLEAENARMRGVLEQVPRVFSKMGLHPSDVRYKLIDSVAAALAAESEGKHV